MRTHTALHVLCGVIWADHRIPVTGGTSSRSTDGCTFPFKSMSTDLAVAIERRTNDEIEQAHEVVDAGPQSR